MKYIISVCIESEYGTQMFENHLPYQEYEDFMRSTHEFEYYHWQVKPIFFRNAAFTEECIQMIYIFRL